MAAKFSTSAAKTAITRRDLRVGLEFHGMAKETEKSLGDEQTRLRGKGPAGEPDTARSLGDSQTLIGGIAEDAASLDETLELTDLAARYSILKALGQGGMGEVLLASDNRLKRQVAIKRIRGEQARSRAAVQRFLTEAQAIAALNHPNIVQVYDYGRDQDGPFLIMEYVDGQSLLERCRDNPLPPEEAVELTCELLGGLGRAHELGIIHRDIKPANILLTRDGRPKLTDFGLAKQTAADQGQTMTGAVLGTIDFMPPEQRRDATLVDARSDLWSLAATLYQMLTGKSPKVIRLDLLPQQLVKTLAQALEEEPTQRFQSAAEFREALRRGLQANETPVAGELKSGYCPQCGIKCESGSKYCHECSAPLRAACLRCNQEIPIWDKACRECGGRQLDLLEQKRTELQRLQANVEQFREAGRIVEALRLVESAGKLGHPRLQDYRHWLERIEPDLREQHSRLAELATAALAEARAHRAAWDYPAAIRTLKSLPPEGRGEEHRQLLAQLEANFREAQDSLQQIQQRVKSRQLDGLLPLVERALQLRGDREDLKKLLDQLKQREARLVSTPAAPPPVDLAADPLRDAFELPPSSGLPLPGFSRPQSGKNTFLLRHVWLIAAAAAGLALLLVGGWLLQRGAERRYTTAAVTENAITATNPGINPAAEPAKPTSEKETKPKDTIPSNSPSSQATQRPPTATKPGAENPAEVTNSIGMKLKLISPGKFLMGKGKEAHEVTLTKPYYLALYEVTQEQYERVMGQNPSRGKGPRNPVENVSWDEAVTFCRKLSDLPAEKTAKRTYRLPTEAEWEFACRAGTTTAFAFGESESQLGAFGWYSGNAGNQSHPVGEKKPNPWGFYDMHGNVWEWCSDWCEDLSSKNATDPFGPVSGSIRVRRGGCWYSGANFCRSAQRGGRSPSSRNDDLGFRIAVSFQEPPGNSPSGNSVASNPATGSPPTAVAPFDAARAVSLQQAWAASLGSGAEVTNSIGMKLRLIPPGTFTMGEGNQKHEVDLTRPFYLGTYEVTNEQYESVNKSNRTTKESKSTAASYCSWEDATAFCRKLSELPAEKQAGRSYRLPTEAEWEYACRAGTTSKFYFGINEGQLPQHGWFEANAGNRAHEVGRKQPNSWGLYDMHGNTWEWCADWYGDYPATAATDPTGPRGGKTKVLRGGSWSVSAEKCTSAYRDGNLPENRFFTYGFRVVLEIKPAAGGNR